MPDTKWWNKKASDLLVGKRVTSVSYMSAKEADKSGWSSRPVVITFNDGTEIYPMRDDEGNDAGALSFQTPNDSGVLPVI